MNSPIHKFESYQIMKACFEVHNQLGTGFLEAVYKDALEIEFKKLNIPFSREVKYEINYLKTSNNKLALLVNFGESSLSYKRIIY